MSKQGALSEASGVTMSLYMVVENFRNGNAVPVYRRFREQGRLAPEGLSYVSSWVHEDLERCYQLMETEDRSLLDKWMAKWSDIIDFEVYPVISSGEAAEKIGLQLSQHWYQRRNSRGLWSIR